MAFAFTESVKLPKLPVGLVRDGEVDVLAGVHVAPGVAQPHIVAGVGQDVAYIDQRSILERVVNRQRWAKVF